MLRNVLEDYLDSINEREFDYPLMAQLQTMGFYDIHFTHGSTEVGKDFIAKRIDDGSEVQYAIQSKKGDISQSLWRNEIRGQLEEAILSDLSHPQFDKHLPRKVVLATTGRLVGNAKLIAQEFKSRLQEAHRVTDLIFWEKEQLVQFAEEFGLSGVHRNTSSGLKGFAQFYLIYSKAIEGKLSDREIEEFSRLWLDETLDHQKLVLRASLEAEIVAAKLIEGGQIYEAIVVYQCLARTLVNVSLDCESELLHHAVDEIKKERILSLGHVFIDSFIEEWNSGEKSLARLCSRSSPLPFLQYLVWCARVLEVLAIVYFLGSSNEGRQKVILFLEEFIDREEGVGHITSDRYGVAIVWATIALLREGKVTHATDLVKRGTIWLCDRVENAFGIARYEADEYEETKVILGYPFDFIDVNKSFSYFTATALHDLSALIGDRQFYADIWNDFVACRIGYIYWQFPDSIAVTTIDNEECLTYSNIPFKESLENSFTSFSHAAHIEDEPTSFKVVTMFGVETLVLLSLLLRDRYFPTQWPVILAGDDNVESKSNN
jgi:hypothetical protein